ncbi:unnamed protein product, partial [Amoebophrya sp. A25]
KKCSGILLLGGKRFDGGSGGKDIRQDVRRHIKQIEGNARKEMERARDRQKRRAALSGAGGVIVGDRVATPVIEPLSYVLSDEDSNFFRDLLEYHPDKFEKLEDFSRIVFAGHSGKHEQADDSEGSGVFCFQVERE